VVAVAVAAPQAARAVAAASLALAASFAVLAVLAVVPLRPFREFAFIMALGVLIDSFLVRSLLVPALISLVGDSSVWPARRFHTTRVAETGGKGG
jgi:putative drug exporter of the RND superfamily